MRNLSPAAMVAATDRFSGFLPQPELSLSLCFYLAPRAGFEPATNRLTAGCSTAELPGNKAQARARRRAYNKSDRAMKASSARLFLACLSDASSPRWGRQMCWPHRAKRICRDVPSSTG